MRGTIPLVVLLLAFTAGCTVGPRYSRPAAPTPAPDAWKTQPPWEQAAPKDSIPKGAWWQIFHDPALDAYEQQLLQAISLWRPRATVSRRLVLWRA